MTRPVSKFRCANDVPFSKQDARKVRQLYRDLLVTMLALEEFDTKRYGWITKDLLISCVWRSTNKWSWIRNDSSRLFNLVHHQGSSKTDGRGSLMITGGPFTGGSYWRKLIRDKSNTSMWLGHCRSFVVQMTSPSLNKTQEKLGNYTGISLSPC